MMRVCLTWRCPNRIPIVPGRKTPSRCPQCRGRSWSNPPPANAYAYGSDWQAVRKRVLERDGYRCQLRYGDICGGGSISVRATCQILPPNLQGYEPFCPYTLEPDIGVWSAPDLDRARALIEDADAIGAGVTALITDNPDVFAPGAVEAMDYIVEVLNELGLRATLKIVHDGFGKYFGAVNAGKAQAYLSGWGSIYPSAHDFIDPQFRCGAPFNISGLCSENLDAAIEDAQRLQATDPSAANGAWIEIEHRLVEEAIWVPLTNPVSTYAFSARTENIQVHPQWGILLSRLWVQ